MNNKTTAIITIILLLITSIFIPSTTSLKLGDNFRLGNLIDTTTNRGDGKTEHWALLIGAGIYADFPSQNLPRLIDYVNDLYDVLIATGWSADHIRLITGEDATVKNIIAGLRWLDRMDDGDDIALVYISTHGISIPGPVDIDIPTDIPPKDEEDGCDEVLLGYWGFAYPPIGVIWDDELNLLLSRLDSKGICLIVWSCQSGGFDDQIFLKKKDRVVITACEEDQIPDYNFPHYLVDGLRGYADENKDGIVSAEEVFNYTKNRVDWYNPTMKDDFEGELPLITVNKNLEKTKNVIDTKKVPKNFKKTDNRCIEKNEPNFRINILPETSIVCGYITDSNTDEPVENANINLHWRDNEGNQESNYTKSNETGFYSLNTAAGDIRLNIYAVDYFSEYGEWLPIGENQTLWINISLTPHPTENSKIFGFVTNAETDEPIEDAMITLNWKDEQEQYYSNNTHTNISGFFEINVAAGEIYLRGRKEDYFTYYSDDYTIDEEETYWINISLRQQPPENSIICGYVKNSTSDEPIEDARISLSWHDEEYNYINNQTFSNSSGFYSMNVAVGSVHLYILANGYYNKEIEYFEVDDNEILWINVSLHQHKPEKSVVCGYIKDSKTNQPIVDARIYLNWRDEYGHSRHNSTYSNLSGYYVFNVEAGEIELSISKEEYFTKYTDWCGIEQNEIFWLNISLEHYPYETSIIQGYVTDFNTGEPIDSIYVSLEWQDDQGNHNNNHTITDLSGFYGMNVAAGDVWIYIFENEYLLYMKRFDIGEEETLWLNISLVPIPDETSIVCGYIKDSKTNEPIEGSDVIIKWCNDLGYTYYNFSDCDSQGFYKINVAPGEIYLWGEADYYNYKRTYRNDIEDGETLWINFSIDMVQFQVDIMKPLSAFYSNNTRWIPFFKPIIFGALDIQAYVHDYRYFPTDAEKVEFYVDDELKATDTTEPFNWTWDERTPLRFRHTIKVIAYDHNGNTASDEIKVWKFL